MEVQIKENTPIMENQMGRKMEHGMEAALRRGFIEISIYFSNDGDQMGH